MNVLSPRVLQGIKVYLSGVILFGGALLIYRYNPYYQSFLLQNNVHLENVPDHTRTLFEAFFWLFGHHTYETLWHLYVWYIGIGFFYFLFSPRADLIHNRPYVAMKGIFSLVRQWKTYLLQVGRAKQPPKIILSQEEKVALLFSLVKFFYLPIMINFFFGNFESVMSNLFDLTHGPVNDDTLIRLVYLGLLNAMYLIDTAYYAFGYMFEFSFLKNKVKSVEPTFLGWIVALMCYPPFNDLTGKYLSWGSTTYTTFWTPFWTIFFLSLSTFFTIIYVWASISLGAKCSNLTNRGIVSRGAYAIVRHPAYISKNLSWLIMGLPLIFDGHTVHLAPLISILAWMFVYFLRAITEERHLMTDPDYQAYCTKVKYRFIPYLV